MVLHDAINYYFISIKIDVGNELFVPKGTDFRRLKYLNNTYTIDTEVTLDFYKTKTRT